MLDETPNYRLCYLDDPVLRKKAAPLTAWTAAETALAQAMADLMVTYRGVGLAAPQLGVLQRLILIHPGVLPAGADSVLVNPEVVACSEETVEEDEGCLSLLSVAAPLARPATVVVRYLDAQGNVREVEAKDFGARALVHEIEHLDGILFVDHLSRLKRRQVQDEFRKLYRELSLG